jgi:hypothetical protein
VLRRVQVLVRDNNVDQALRVLKKKIQREGIFREMKLTKTPCDIIGAENVRRLSMQAL